ncbi:MAG TPA: HPF/RaiA family ribosome-associated protein [Egibacteraceae bacterium]|nr:HPF/RaiA family ribosome-associated protein [Egibacteraceae bacterium]
MQPLTHRVWARHFAQLRPYIIKEFPEVPPEQLDVVGDDFDGLVELVQQSTGWSADLVHQRLRTLDVEELGLGTGDADEQPEEGQRASLAQLRLGAGFGQDERERIVQRLSKLDRRLRKFPSEGTDLELSVKDRGSTTQKVTLECWLPKFPRVVATSREQDLRAALMEVREDLWRQIDDAVGKRKAGT